MARDGMTPDLFTKRVRKPPPPKEDAVHIAVADTLRVGLAPGWFWWHTPNGEYRRDETAAKLQRMGVQPGVSDFLLLNPAGALFALELKRKGVKPTEAQKLFLRRVALGRGGAGWADSYDGAITLLRSWGCLMERLHIG